jgi:hypothetical protein
MCTDFVSCSHVHTSVVMERLSVEKLLNWRSLSWRRNSGARRQIGRQERISPQAGRKFDLITRGEHWHSRSGESPSEGMRGD